MSDLVLVLVDVDSRLEAGASLVDLLGTLIFCNATTTVYLCTAIRHMHSAQTAACHGTAPHAVTCLVTQTETL